MKTEYIMEMGLTLPELQAKVKDKEILGWKCEGDVCVFISKVDNENYFQAMVKNS